MKIAAAFDLDIDQMDVSNAFLQAVIPSNEHIFFSYNLGFNQLGRCPRLLRALYSMKYSPIRWQHYLNRVLQDIGFQQVSDEGCLISNGRIIILYDADNLATLSPKENRDELDNVRRQLAENFDIGYFQELEWFLGICVVRVKAARKLWLTQDIYIYLIVPFVALDSKTVRLTLSH